jgi:Flp pilus assembly protein TadD
LDGLKVGVRTGLADALEEVASAGGDAAAILERYHEIKGVGTDELSVVPEPLNILGNKLLDAGRTPEAIAVFEINVTEFPGFWGWYDNLARAYVKAGEKALAVENYRKALELNPDNPTLQEALQREL